MDVTTGANVLRALATTVLIALSSAGLAANAVPPPHYERMQEILMEVMGQHGHIDRQLHDELWHYIAPGADARKLTPAEKAAVDRLLTSTLATTTRFQIETWTSAKLSIEAHRVVETKGYEPAKRAVLAAMDDPGYQMTAQLGAKHADELLAAAAGGVPMDTPHGPVLITSELTDQILGRISETMQRLKMLLNPVWTGE